MDGKKCRHWLQGNWNVATEHRLHYRIHILPESNSKELPGAQKTSETRPSTDSALIVTSTSVSVLKYGMTPSKSPNKHSHDIPHLKSC